MISVRQQQQRLTFEWSLKPLTIWAAIIGIDLGLNPKGRLSTVPRFLVLALGFVLFLSNLWVNIEALGYAYYLRFFLRPVTDITVLIKVLSGFTADGILFTGLPLIFFVSSLFGNRWKKVREQLCYIEQEAQFSEKFHRECRKQCFISLVLLFVDMALTFPQQWTSKTNSLVGLPTLPFEYALAMTVLSRLSAVTVQTIFLVCVSTARLLFKDLQNRLQDLFTIPVTDAAVGNKIITVNKAGSDTRIMNDKEKLESWLRCYDSVCTLVEKTNHCFGLILVITLCHNIIYTIRYSTLVFQMVENINNPNLCTVFMTTLIRVSALFGIVLRMWTIFVESHHMSLEACRLRHEVGRATQPSTNNLQFETQQVTMLLLQVTINQPMISAMDFFFVDLTWLFPLEGAILSYVILIQKSQQLKGDTVDYSKISNQLGMCVLQNKI